MPPGPIPPLTRREWSAVPEVLIIEDDRDLSDILAYNLKQAGYEVRVACDGRDGLHQARCRRPDVVILDVMLPVIDGLEVCRRLRADPAQRDVPVVMLTARSEERDHVAGLAIGADDYVTKPFSVRILLERIRALLRRRRESAEPGDVLQSQGVVLDRCRHTVTVNGTFVELTRSEFALLEVLIRQPGRAFTRGELIDSGLGDVLVLERTIDVHIRAIRRKLGPAAALIETVRGVGYRFRDPRRSG